MTPTFTASDLRRAIDVSLAALRAQRAAIDGANVFPVPDGDTGTNLVMTFEATAAALADAGDGDAEIARAIKSGSLMGARGNSGVIVSQILRALAEAIEGGPVASDGLRAALARAADLAYEAVLMPAEGTILSVARGAAEGASGSTPAEVLSSAARAAREALAATPDQMPLLRQAGVVDAGGMGLVAVLEAFAEAAGGAPGPERSGAAAILGPAACVADVAVAAGDGSVPFAFEVQYLLEAPDDRVPALRHLLGTIGDSVAVVGGGGMWRVHVHTDEPDRAVLLGSAVGRTAEVETIAFADQIAATRRSAAVPPEAEAAARVSRAPESSSQDDPSPPGARGVALSRDERAASLVAVAAGRGVAALFEGLGARTVAGGPDASALVDAISAAPARHVVVLPNDEDLFSVALEAARLASDKEVEVMRTTDAAEGLVVALAYGEGRRVEDVVRDMREILGRVVSGQVIIAPLAITTPVGDVSAGEAVGIVDGVPAVIDADPVLAAIGVADELMKRGSVLTVLAGEGASREEIERLAALLSSRVPSADVHEGGQPRHRYLLAVE